ncbi:MAG: RNA polymerase sigma-70 factor [Ekhidna sp.]|nr:RNA polymerase sigma-70 factor [Ekhidna sp.]
MLLELFRIKSIEMGNIELQTLSAEDSKLVRKIKVNNEQAYKELFFKYGKKLYYFSRKQNLSHEDAEGVVQDVFTKLWEVWKTLNEELSINSYIFTIAKNLIYNKSRKNVNKLLFEKYLLTNGHSSSSNTEDEVIFRDYKNIIEEVIAELSPRAQEIFKMNRFEGRTNQEIADQLNISKGTVENQVHFAMKYIKKQLIERTNLDLTILLAIVLSYY